MRIHLIFNGSSCLQGLRSKVSEQKAPVNKNVLLPLLLFLSFPLEEQCVGDRDEEGNLGFALYFPGWMFSGCRAVLGKGWHCSPGVCWGSLRTAETCVRTAINTQPISSASMRSDGDNTEGDGQSSNPCLQSPLTQNPHHH